MFSAGNGSFSAEAQVPGVLAAGGVFSNAGLELQASDYSSGYHSAWFGGVDLPTVSGLVGMRPRASYIMMPIPAGCPIDVERAAAGGGDPPDGTGPSDGWALFSGTSAAAPQLAGAAAVLRGIRRSATPAEVIKASATPRSTSASAALAPALQSSGGTGPGSRHRVRADRRVQSRGGHLSGEPTEPSHAQARDQDHHARVRARRDAGPGVGPTRCSAGLTGSRSTWWRKVPGARRSTGVSRSTCPTTSAPRSPTTRCGCRARCIDPASLFPRIIHDPDRDHLDFLSGKRRRGRFVCSVCEGALLLAVRRAARRVRGDDPLGVHPNLTTEPPEGEGGRTAHPRFVLRSKPPHRRRHLVQASTKPLKLIELLAVYGRRRSVFSRPRSTTPTSGHQRDPEHHHLADARVAQTER